MFECLLTSEINTDGEDDNADHSDNEPGHSGRTLSGRGCKKKSKIHYRLKHENWPDNHPFSELC